MGIRVLATGSPGGSTIITTVLQVVINVLDHGMDVADAVGMPRFHHQWLPDRVIYEPWGISPDTLKILAEPRPYVRDVAVGARLGDANSVMRSGDELLGMSDPRNRGGAAGY